MKTRGRWPKITTGTTLFALALTAGCTGAATIAEAAKTAPATASTTPTAAPTFEPADADFDAAAALMKARAKAVMAGDKKAFLATVDRANKKLLAKQSTMFDNLRKLRPASVTFEPAGYGMPPTELPGDDPTLGTDITEYVFLKGRSSAMRTEVAAVFVRRDGTWLLGALRTSGAPYDEAWYGPEISVATVDGVTVGCVPWSGVDRPRDSLREDQARRSGLRVSWSPPVWVGNRSSGRWVLAE